MAAFKYTFICCLIFCIHVGQTALPLNETTQITYDKKLGEGMVLKLDGGGNIQSTSITVQNETTMISNSTTVSEQHSMKEDTNLVESDGKNATTADKETKNQTSNEAVAITSMPSLNYTTVNASLFNYKTNDSLNDYTPIATHFNESDGILLNVHSNDTTTPTPVDITRTSAVVDESMTLSTPFVSEDSPSNATSETLQFVNDTTALSLNQTDLLNHTDVLLNQSTVAGNSKMSLNMTVDDTLGNYTSILLNQTVLVNNTNILVNQTELEASWNKTEQTSASSSKETMTSDFSSTSSPIASSLLRTEPLFIPETSTSPNNDTETTFTSLITQIMLLSTTAGSHDRFSTSSEVLEVSFNSETSVETYTPTILFTTTATTALPPTTTQEVTAPPTTTSTTSVSTANPTSVSNPVATNTVTTATTSTTISTATTTKPQSSLTERNNQDQNLPSTDASSAPVNQTIKTILQQGEDYVKTVVARLGPAKTVGIIALIFFVFVLLIACICHCRKRRKYGRLGKVKVRYGQEKEFLLHDKRKGKYESDRVTLLDETSEDEF